MSAPLPDPTALAAPLGPEAPAGPDLSYDADFLALEQAGAGRPEQQYGDTVIAAEPPDWPTVGTLALALAGRTRDLRVLVWLARARARQQGLAGYAAVLSAMRRCCDDLWPHLHPELEDDGSPDATMRLNALAPLAAAEAGLADLRQCALAPQRGSLRLRELELGLGAATADADESCPTADGVRQALQALLTAHPALADQAEALHADLDAMATLAREAPSVSPPDLDPLLALSRLLRDAVRAARTDGAATSVAPATQADTDPAQASTAPDRASGHTATTARSAAAASGPAPLHDRDDVARELQRLADWLERHEPAHPAPLLLRRAHRLLGMSFIDIVRELAPDGLAQIERIAGSESG